MAGTIHDECGGSGRVAEGLCKPCAGSGEAPKTAPSVNKVASLAAAGAQKVLAAPAVPGVIAENPAKPKKAGRPKKDAKPK